MTTSAYVDQKMCEFCGKTYNRPDSCPVKVWEGRRFCSKSCATRSRYDEVVPKKCTGCGSIIKKRKNQSISSYNKQRYCSLSCRATNGTNTTKFKGGGLHACWGDGVYIDNRGYVVVLTGKNTYTPLHRLIMEWKIGRGIDESECVHHKNLIKTDNRVENLELLTKSEHSKLHCSHLRGEGVKTRAAIARRSKYSKEKHNKWRSDVTQDRIDLALRMFETKKDAAKYLGIHPDTLRARIKNYKMGEVK